MLQVNFQPDGVATPAGFIADIGEAFDDLRGFGWVTQNSLGNPTATPIDISPNARDRNAVADQEQDTLIHMQLPAGASGVTTPAAWEHAVENGQYNVTVSVGDPSFFDSQHLINVEGVEAISSFEPTPSQPFSEVTVLADVSDGKLTIDALGGTNTKINFVEFEPVSDTIIDEKINFQPEGVTIPDGFIADIGEAFDGTRGFGWVTQNSLGNPTATPIDISPNARDRNTVAAQEQDTLIHMQLPADASGVNTPAAWEFALPNDEYIVTVSVGDPSFFDSQHLINVEGLEAIPSFEPTPSQPFAQATVLVNVSDDKLTLDALGGTNTKINFVELLTASGDITPPTASLTAADLIAGGGTTYDFTVTYSDNTAVAVATLDDNDIQVTGPNGFIQNATLLGVNVNSDGTPRTATYSINAPNGSWDMADNGEYTIALLSSQVSDIVANFSPAATLGSFQVNISDVEPAPFEVKVNFQPEGAAIPEEFIADTGEAFDDTRGFGWVRQDSLGNPTATPIDISPNARDRNRPGVTQRLDTLIHMQLPAGSNGVTTPAAWELTVPDGLYSVTVSVGDSFTDSEHVINVEGVEAIPLFDPATIPIQEYELASATVEVTDGRLTIDAVGGTNTKINFVEIETLLSGEHPSVVGSNPPRREVGVDQNQSISLDLSLLGGGAGVDPATLTTDNVQLFRTLDNAFIDGIINSTGGLDAITYRSTNALSPNTNYTLRLGSGVQDQLGNSFLPFSTTFSTGESEAIDPLFNFEEVFQGALISSLVVSPDGSQLYAAALDGILRRWTIDGSGNLTNLQTFDGLVGTSGIDAPRAIIGITFDPDDPNVLWVSHNDTIFVDPAEDFTGKISKLTLQGGSGFNATIEDYVVGLPRSTKDHLSNSLAFGPDGNLYLSQGSNSAMGALDGTWNREERLLTGAILQIDPNRTPPPGGFNVQTEDYTPLNPISPPTTGNYDPFAPDAPVKIFGTGIRNAYDLVWHSNGSLYAPTNGSAAGGNTPDNPSTGVDEELNNVATQNDFLFKVSQGGYYGHPNPLRNEYILNGGNPTSGIDPAQVVSQSPFEGYPVGVQPEWDINTTTGGGFVFDFDRNRSPNGSIEYENTNTFGGALANNLLVTEFSGGKDVLALPLDVNGNVIFEEVKRVAFDNNEDGITDFRGPLDLAEAPNGNVYMADLLRPSQSNPGEGRIFLLTPA